MDLRYMIVLAMLVVLVFPSGYALASSSAVNNVNGPVNIVKHGNSFNAEVVNATGNVTKGAITNSKVALHSINQTQLAFNIHNGTNGVQGPTGPQGVQGIPGPAGVRGIQGSPGKGNITIYNIPYGHDGWFIDDPSQSNDCAGGNQMCNAGPYIQGSPSGNPQGTVIQGSDLGNITSNSFVIAEQIGPTTVIGNGQGNSNAVKTPDCSVWTPFAGGFHAFCPLSTTSTSLRVIVINP